MKSLIPLILFLSTVVLLTVVLSNTQTIRLETTRGEAQDPDIGHFSMDAGSSLLNIPSADQRKRPTPAERLSLDRLALDATAALVDEDYETAISNSRTLLIFDPQNYTALSVLGKSLFLMDRFKDAELVYQRQAVFYTTDPVVFANLGYTQAQLGKYKQALDGLQEALRLDPRSGDILLSMAGICIMDGQKERAMNYLQMAGNRMGPRLLDLLQQPIFDDVREDPAFLKIVRTLQEKKDN